MNLEEPILEPVLSIITPTRNAGKTLQRCLNSVNAQHYSNWEHWIIDSVSTDDTVKIVLRAAENDSRVHVISEIDGGVYDAMNKGIRLARGEWVYFLGADDELFDAQVLLVMLGNENIKYDFVYGNVVFIPGGQVYDGQFDLAKLLITNISHQAIFCRRAILDRLGGFDLRFNVHADWAFNIKCMLDPTIRTRYVDTVVANFQLGGISSRVNVLDSGLHDERMALLCQRLKLVPPDCEIVLSLVDELIRKAEEASNANYWRGRYENLLNVHNNLIHSYLYRFFLSLTFPIKSTILFLQRTMKWITNK
jgi:glycosyltransferase involved in cell wall biosynthesis